ncbi:MAG TPA: hypothetical protein DFS52_08600 [Myxococcales bacterium]|nr:hypothetical protein [Myxococcales bacterium]
MRFTIDAEPPTISIEGVSDGLVSNAAQLLPLFSASDPHLANLSALLGGVPFDGGTPVSSEGDYTLVVSASDAAGNVAMVEVGFAIDRTAPEITLAGVHDGLASKTAVAPSFATSDPHPGPVSAKLNGFSFESGTTVSAEGDYELSITASDAAGNQANLQASFAIDATAPAISVAGVTDGEQRNLPATITYSAADAHLQAVSATLNGQSFESGGTVAAPGSYELVVTASDTAGNSSELRRTFAIDTEPPVIAVESPQSGLITKLGQVEIVASVTDDGPISSVAAGATALTPGTDGKYRASVSLVEGSNLFELVAFDGAGNSAGASISVVRDSTPPQVTVLAPAEGATISGTSTTVSGTVSDATQVTVTVNGASAALDGSGSFAVTVALETGVNTISIVATDVAGNRASVTRQVTGNLGPQLVITAPEDGLSTTDSAVVVSGTATAEPDASPVIVQVAGRRASVDAAGNFTSTVALELGPQTITVVAVDGLGRSREASVSVTRVEAPASDGGVGLPDAGALADAGSPGAGDAGSVPGDAGLPGDAGPQGEPPTLIVEAPDEDAVLGIQSIAVRGRIEGGTLPLQVTISGQPATVSARYFSASLALPEGEHAVTIAVTDAVGRSTSVVRSFGVDRTAPYLTIDRPQTNPAQVSESPYRLEGTVGDEHLAGVTVDGEPVTVLAGQYAASIPLTSGETEVGGIDAAY